jgi:DNA-directed RNA polymerase subunit RPC12/RpoP
MNKNVIKGLVVGGIVLIAVLGWALYQPSNNANFPDGTDWLCTNAQCKTAFNLSIEQLSDYSKDHAGEPIKCPKCGTASVRAEKCVHCGKVFPMSNAGHRCPFCGKDNAVPVG